MEETEIWVQITEYPRYEVSSHGRVRHVGTQQLMTLHPKSRGLYWGVNLTRQGVRRSDALNVHVLVCSAFYGPRPKGKQARHLNNDGHNNRKDNLMWSTPVTNAEDKKAFGTSNFGRKNGMARLSDQDVLAIFVDTRVQKVIAEQYGVAQQHVSEIKIGRVWAELTERSGLTAFRAPRNRNRWKRKE